MRPPEILIPGKINEVNEYILNKTGCFAFLTVDDMWVYSEPQTGKGAVELWSIALYTIYHDYGCRYLRFILDSNNKPNNDIEEKLNRSLRHLKTVQYVLRPNVAHGTLDKYTREELKRIFFSREDYTLEEMPEEQWYRVAEKIRKESDELIDVLYKWADGYQNNCNIRSIFGNSEEFKMSIDSRVLFDSLDNDFDKNKKAKRILEEQSKKLPDEKIELWRKEISSQFISEELKTPGDIIAKLKSYLFDIHQPVQRSSVAIGDSLGYSLSELLAAINLEVDKNS